MEVVKLNLGDAAMSLIMNDEFSKSSKKGLLPAHVFLSFVGKLPMPKVSLRVRFPHRPSDITVCIIVKDLRKTNYDASNVAWKSIWQRSPSSPEPTLPRVTFLPVSELKLAYQSFDAKRKLWATFDVFLADKRIIHHLPSNLGKAFYGGNTEKIPIPVSMDGKDLVKSVTNALSTSLLLIRGNGTTESFKVGDIQMPFNHVKENILSVTEDILKKWPGGLSSLRSIYARGAGPSVPLYFDDSEVPVEEATKSLALLQESKGNRFNLEFADSTDEEKRLARQLVRFGSNLPIASLLEAAKSLPLTDVDLTQAFHTKSKYKKKAKSNKKRQTDHLKAKVIASNKPMKSAKGRKSVKAE